MPSPFTTSAQALSAAESSAWTAYTAIKGALIQSRTSIGADHRREAFKTDLALRNARKLVEQLEAARVLISNHEREAA